MIKIKQTLRPEADVATILSQDLIWLCLGLMVGFVIPFMVWLWVTTHLSNIFLAQVA